MQNLRSRCESCGTAIALPPGPHRITARELCFRCRALPLRHIDVDSERVFCAHCWRSQVLHSEGPTRHALVFDRFLVRHASCPPGESL